MDLERDLKQYHERQCPLIEQDKELFGVNNRHLPMEDQLFSNPNLIFDEDLHKGGKHLWGSCSLPDILG